jgi:hypothetical protein
MVAQIPLELLPIALAEANVLIVRVETHELIPVFLQYVEPLAGLQSLRHGSHIVSRVDAKPLGRRLSRIVLLEIVDRPGALSHGSLLDSPKQT